MPPLSLAPAAFTFWTALAAAALACPAAAMAAEKPAEKATEKTAEKTAERAASAPSLAPSAPLAEKPEKRPATPEEKRDSATAPGDLRPGSRVTPQLNIPLNASGAGKPAYVRPPRGKAAPSGGIDDSTARCNAISEAQARKECLDKLR